MVEIEVDTTAQAVYLRYIEEMTQDEIANQLDVSQPTVSRMLNSDLNEEMQEGLRQQALNTRLVAFEELKSQLPTVAERAESAETITEVWGDEVSHIDIRDSEGVFKKRVPVPDGFEKDVDHAAQAQARNELREILYAMSEITGATELDED